MHALIDCDILCYEIGSAKDESGEHPLDWGLVKARVDARLEQIQDAVEAGAWTGYLSGEGNFRYDISTIRPYKGHRPSEKPFWYQGIFNYLRDKRQCNVISGMEADDAIVIDHWKNYEDSAVIEKYVFDPNDETVLIYEYPLDHGTVICSRDKDFNQVPGWHYVWPSWKQEERKPYWVTETEGHRAFYTQLLVGDRADNIPGLYGVGLGSAHVAHINEMDNELSMFEYVKEQYEKRFGSYWKLFLEENAKLLWLKRHEEDDWCLETHTTLPTEEITETST